MNFYTSSTKMTTIFSVTTLIFVRQGEVESTDI